jgi:glycosyltransferase involved in cell wall biosynthesis
MATLLVPAGRGPAVAVHRRVDFPVRHPWRYRRADAVIAVSHGVAGVLARGGVRDNVHVVHDGVRVPPDTGPTPAADAPRPWWGACGALVAHKGHVHLIDAMVDLPGTLWIAGEGPLRAALLRRAEQRGVSARVRLVGHVEPLGAWLRSLDVFVHPSVEEGFGQVLIEALGAGCRVVATLAGGAPEAVGEAGRLVPPARPDLLAVSMRELLAAEADPEHARQRASLYSVERMVEGTSAVYRALSASRAR